MSKIDVSLIAHRLFQNPRIKARICADYGIGDPGTPEELAAGMVHGFGQDCQIVDASRPEVTNQHVFRAAVLALASNNRSWSVFLRHETRLQSLLAGYDPVQTAGAHKAGRLQASQLEECLAGQTSSADSKAVLHWAERLSQDIDYYAAITKLRDAIASKSDVGKDEIVPTVAVLLGESSARMERQYPPPPGLGTWKMRGMGAVLRSEFLRNLHWSGFKPDRHIKRLLRMWFPEIVVAQLPRAMELAWGGEKLGIPREN